MLSNLLQPWRTARTWRSLVHTVLDLPIGAVTFAIAIALLATSLGLAITLPLALPVVWALFVFTEGVGRMERSRFAALHDEVLPPPAQPLPRGSVWARFKARLASKARWKQVAYSLLLLPVGAVAFVTTTVSWSGSLALFLLPTYVSALPQDTAQFWLFGVSQGPAAIGASLVGLVGLVAIAPWVTVLAGRVDVLLGRWLLAPSPDVELAAKAERAETGRAAAVGAAEAERRRIERDLHDGAQQRLVALAMDLGAARERLDSDPAGGKELVAEAHEEAKSALREIRDLVRGIHPVILEDRGLDAALSAVVARSPIPVDLTIELPTRPPAAVESAAYFVVSEALANVARHSQASKAHVGIVRSGDRLIVEVRDNGIGGADPTTGTGLTGLADRVVGMGGTMDLLSPAGGPTTMLVELPCAS